MNYIRTEDKVLEFMPFTGGKDGEICEYRDSKNIYKVSYLDIAKQADTIEELCDEFAVWQEDYKMPVTMPLTEKDTYEKVKKVILLGINNEIKCWLKLAIWTEWGLKYVAKMNEKGELKLL